MRSPGTPDPLALVGWWEVAGAEQRVLVDPARFEIHDRLAVTEGSWRGDAAGRFIATFDSIAPVGDDPGSAPTRAPAWLDAATSYAIDGAARLLRERSGTDVARLVPAEPGETSGWADPSRPPTPDELELCRPVGPVPSGLTAATAATLVGHWRPAGFVGSTRPWATLGHDGKWTGTDGCNRVSGRWVAGADGGLLATASAARTLIACDGVDIGAQIGAARQAAFDGDGALLLLDAAGRTVGRFAQA